MCAHYQHICSELLCRLQQGLCRPTTYHTTQLASQRLFAEPMPGFIHHGFHRNHQPIPDWYSPPIDQGHELPV